MELTFVIIYTLLATLPLTVGTAILRHSLYQELKKLQINVEALSDPRGANSVSRSDLIRNLETKSREASLRSIEQIDTSSLLEEVWNNSKFRWEQKNRFCQVVPNLLLAIGVLGTFLGLSLVLLTLSSSVSSSNSIEQLKANLEQALGGMGIAFLSSLSAIVCSIFLTIFNLIRNTNLSKDRLFNSLENYLSNIYLPRTIRREEGYLHTQVDRIIAPLNGLSEKVESSFNNLFGNFLSLFTSSIYDAVKLSFGEKIREITDLHLSFHQETRQEVQSLIDQASQVYARFGESSTLLFAGANRLKESAEEAANILENSANKFRENIESSSETLVNSTSGLQGIFNSLDDNTMGLQQVTKEVSQAIESSVIKLQEAVEISNKAMETSANSFQQASSQSIERSTEFSRQLSSISSEFSQSVSRLGNSIQSSEEALSLLNNLGKELGILTTGNRALNQNVQQALSSVGQTQEALMNTNTELQEERETFKSVAVNLNKLYNQIDNFTQSNNQFLETIIEQFQSRERTVQESAENISRFNLQSEKLSENNYNSLRSISENLENGSRVFEAAATILQKDFSRAMEELKKYSTEVHGSRSEFQRLAIEVKHQVDTLQSIQIQFSELVKFLSKSSNS